MANVSVPYPELGLASFDVLDTWLQTWLLVGGGPELQTYPYTIEESMTLVQGQVVGLNGSKRIVPAVASGGGAVQAIGVMAVSVTTGAGDTTTTAPVYYSGSFSAMGLTWDATYSTLALQEAAFRGAPTPTQIVVKLRQSDIWVAP